MNQPIPTPFPRAPKIEAPSFINPDFLLRLRLHMMKLLFDRSFFIVPSRLIRLLPVREAFWRVEGLLDR